jgi:hypothetical protein
MLSECLGVLLHTPRGPFYSPKVARSRWRSTWKSNLAFYRVVHRTGPVVVLCSIPFLIWRIRPLGRRSHWRTVHCPVHTGQSGVPNRPLARATRRPLIALVTVGSGGSEPPDSLVNFSRSVLGKFPRATSSSPMYLGASIEDSPDSPVHHQTVR